MTLFIIIGMRRGFSLDWVKHEQVEVAMLGTNMFVRHKNEG